MKTDTDRRLPPLARGPLLAALSIGWVAAAAACAPEAPSEQVGPEEVSAEQQSRDRSGSGGPVVLAVDGERTTRGEFERQLEEMPDFVRAQFKSADKKREMLAALAQFEAMADIAERRGLGDDPAVLDALEEDLQRRALREAVRDEVPADAISEEAVETYYEEHAETYRTPERRAALVVETESERRAERIREELAEVSGTVDERVEALRKVASRRSVDPISGRRGGSVGWVRAPDHEEEYPAIAEAIFDLEEPGGLTDVFRSGDRWYVATWRKREAPQREPLEEVAGEIRAELLEKRRTEARERILREWRENAEIEVPADLAERLDAPEPPRRSRREQIPIRTADEERSSE